MNATGNLAAANRELGAHVEIGSVMFDCESWEWSTSGPKASAEFRTQMTRKNELTYNATRRLLPRALIINYAYGAVEWRPDTPTAACVGAASRHNAEAHDSEWPRRLGRAPDVAEALALEEALAALCAAEIRWGGG